MIVRTGTSGFSYAEWKGGFYPEKISPSRMLAFYAEHLDAVEINSSFYRIPRRSVLESWRDQVPDTFRFYFKAHRRINTHSSVTQPAFKLIGSVPHRAYADAGENGTLDEKQGPASRR